MPADLAETISKIRIIMKKHSLLQQTGIAAVALLALGVTSVGRADQSFDTAFAMPNTIKATVNSSDCDNSGGPEVTLDGTITLGGFKAKFIFKNNKKGTHTATVVSERTVTLVPLDGAITIPKQPV